MAELADLLDIYNHFTYYEEAERALNGISACFKEKGFFTVSDILTKIDCYERHLLKGSLLEKRFDSMNGFHIERREDYQGFCIHIPGIDSYPPALTISIKSCCVNCRQAYWAAAPYFSEPKYLGNPDIRSAELFCKHNKVCKKYLEDTIKMRLCPEEDEEE